MTGHAGQNSAMSCVKMPEAIDLLFGLWTRVGRRMYKFRCICQVAPMCNLANMNEPSVCDGSAALCQITLTTCSKWWLSAILNFQNWQILTVTMVKTVNVHHRAKFCDDYSTHCGEMAVFRFFKMVYFTILDL